MAFNRKQAFVERTEFLTSHEEESVLLSQSNVHPFFDGNHLSRAFRHYYQHSHYCLSSHFSREQSSFKNCCWFFRGYYTSLSRVKQNLAHNLPDFPFIFCLKKNRLEIAVLSFVSLIGFPGAPSAIKISKVRILIEVLFFLIALPMINAA